MYIYNSRHMQIILTLKPIPPCLLVPHFLQLTHSPISSQESNIANSL